MGRSSSDTFYWRQINFRISPTKFDRSSGAKIRSNSTFRVLSTRAHSASLSVNDGRLWIHTTITQPPTPELRASVVPPRPCQVWPLPKVGTLSRTAAPVNRHEMHPTAGSRSIIPRPATPNGTNNNATVLGRDNMVLSFAETKEEADEFVKRRNRDRFPSKDRTAVWGACRRRSSG